MRWLWFGTCTLICSLLSVLFRQPLILLGELLVIDLFLTRRMGRFLIRDGKLWKVPVWLNMALWLAFTVWVIRLLIFDSLVVDHAANRPALHQGDCILVFKLPYGPALPQTPLELPFYRLPGLSHVKRGELVAYHYPEGDSVFADNKQADYHAIMRVKRSAGDTMPAGQVKAITLARRRTEVSRCTALPGDTLSIRNGQVVMDRLLSGDSIATDSLGGDYNIFPHDARYPWNRDNFGPLIVPRKGDQVRLTLLNISLYRRIIEIYEHQLLEIRGDTILINHSPNPLYTFRQDYFLVLGDNRLQSRDSRHWGFLPSDHLIGKPVLIWFSADHSPERPFKINWNRIFKSL